MNSVPRIFIGHRGSTEDQINGSKSGVNRDPVKRCRATSDFDPRVRVADIEIGPRRAHWRESAGRHDIDFFRSFFESFGFHDLDNLFRIEHHGPPTGNLFVDFLNSLSHSGSPELTGFLNVHTSATAGYSHQAGQTKRVRREWRERLLHHLKKKR